MGGSYRRSSDFASKCLVAPNLLAAPLPYGRPTGSLFLPSVPLHLV